jgi:hypothetical protein
LDPVVETEKRIGNFRVNRKVEWGKEITGEPSRFPVGRHVGTQMVPPWGPFRTVLK